MSCSASTSESESSEGDDTVPIFFAVRASKKELPIVEQDLIHARCTKLRNEMRKRVTLPLFAANLTEVKSGIALPLYSCPYKKCDFSMDDRCMFLHHVCGGVSDTTHKKILIKNDILNKDLPWMTPYDYVHSAAAIAE